MSAQSQQLNLSPIKQMELLASKIPDVVSLAQGIPSFDTPEIIKKAAAKALNRGAVAKYSLTPGLPEFRETIEQKLAEEGMYYDFEKEIIATAGAIEALTATFLAIFQGSLSGGAKGRRKNSRKKEVILLSPTYTSYQEAIKVAGGIPIFVNLIEESGWQLNFADLIRKINSRTAAILICNPNNPTGTILSKKILLKIADWAERKNFFIVTDEVYKDFIYSDTEFFTLAQIPELRKRVIRIFSLSKAYAMTGWRIGFLHSDEENVKEILKIHDAMVTCAPVISQYAALAALDFGARDVEKFRLEFQSRRDLICQHLDELKDFLSYQKPTSSYFVFPRLTRTNADYDAPPLARPCSRSSGRASLAFGGDTRGYIKDNLPKDLQSSASWKFALSLLYKAHVAVVPGVAFGPNGENHFRMSFGRSAKDIEEAMKRIKAYFRSCISN